MPLSESNSRGTVRQPKAAVTGMRIVITGAEFVKKSPGGYVLFPGGVCYPNGESLRVHDSQNHDSRF